MRNIRAIIWDGRYFVNEPDCIIIATGYKTIYVSIETWNKLTNNAKVQVCQSGMSATLTKELLSALSNESISNPPKTNNTRPNNLPDNACKRCGGLGFIEAYKSVNGGVCFECNGITFDKQKE